MFLYREVLKQPLEDIDAERAKRLPVVLNQTEVAALLGVVEGDVGRIIELLGGQLEVHGGKGELGAEDRPQACRLA